MIELTRSLAAINKGIPVKSVALFAFGGMPRIRREDTLPSCELLVALVGLLAKLIISGIFYLIYLLLANAGNFLIGGLIQWLAFIYFMLFLFHFIPGLPLDGGSVLRTLLWVKTGDYDRATRIANWTGRGIGLLLIAGGVLAMVIDRQWFVGLLLIFFGWPLENAAVLSRRQTVPHEALRNTTARDIMTVEGHLITPQLSLGQLVRDYILVTGQHFFTVADGAEFQGIVTMSDIKSIPKDRWGSTLVGEVMTPASELKTAHPEQAAGSLFEQMEEAEISHLPVLECDRVIGVVAWDSLTRLIKVRNELRL